jgi:antitoxin VapB
MAISTVFNNNRTQAVRLPAEMRFPDSVKKVEVRVAGQERIIAPAESAWDSFFLGATSATEDFMDERASQFQAERESL